MRIQRSLPFILLTGLLGLCLTMLLHACQPANVVQPTATSQPTNVAQVAPTPVETPLPPETIAIAQSAGTNGLFKPTRGDVRFVAISDLNSAYGSTDYDPEVDRAIKLLPFWNPDLVLCSGDMVAAQSPSLSAERLKEMWAAFDQRIAAPMRQMKLPYGFTVGNHDASSALTVNGTFLFPRDRAATTEYWQDPAHNSGVQFVDKFEFPFYYTFQFKDVFFLVWDGSSSYIPPAKLAWVEKALGSEPAQAAKLRVLLGHLPLYAVAEGRNQAGDVMDNADELRATLEKYKVHTYISGHHHAYYPAHKGKMQLLHMGLLGSGPRPYIEGSLAPRKSLTVIDVNFNAKDLTTYTTYDMQTLQVIDIKTLPRSLVGVNGRVLRRDIELNALSTDEQNLCVNRFGVPGCSA